MKKNLWQVFMISGMVAGTAPAWSAPTDPSASGTMDVSADRHDTSNDTNENPTLRPKTHQTNDSYQKMKPKRHSPKVDPSVNTHPPTVDTPGNVENIKPTPTTPAAQTAPSPAQSPSGY